MAYEITALSGADEERRALAEFLARFVRDGELALPRSGDDDPSVWLRRMRWWWDENPACREDSPRGFLLRHEEAGLVGFSGLIPFVYESAGDTLPTLVTTTLFVRDRHRSAVMGLIAKQRALAREFQIIDGSPSPEMRRLLAKLGYEHAGDRAQYWFPTRRCGGAPARLALIAGDRSVPLPSAAEAAECRLIIDPGQWTDPAPESKESAAIRRVSDPATLSWLARCGSEPRTFFGLVDAEGTPIARALGVYKQRAGVNVCLFLDHADFHHGGIGLLLLVKKLLSDPAAGLARDTAAIVISRFGSSSWLGVPGRRVASILHYHLPTRWQGRPRVCLPVEGDLVLL